MKRFPSFVAAAAAFCLLGSGAPAAGHNAHPAVRSCPHKTPAYGAVRAPIVRPPIFISPRQLYGWNWPAWRWHPQWNWGVYPYGFRGYWGFTPGWSYRGYAPNWRVQPSMSSWRPAPREPSWVVESPSRYEAWPDDAEVRTSPQPGAGLRAPVSYDGSLDELGREASAAAARANALLGKAR